MNPDEIKTFFQSIEPEDKRLFLDEQGLVETAEWAFSTRHSTEVPGFVKDFLLDTLALITGGTRRTPVDAMISSLKLKLYKKNLSEHGIYKGGDTKTVAQKKKTEWDKLFEV